MRTPACGKRRRLVSPHLRRCERQLQRRLELELGPPVRDGALVVSAVQYIGGLLYCLVHVA